MSSQGSPAESAAESASGPNRPLDPLVALLLPSVIHRLGNATQLLTGLNSMLGFGDQESLDLVAGRGQDLVRAGLQAERVGYALAVIGSAQGSGLLLARRVGRGAEWLVDFLREALRRGGLELPEAELPDLDPAGGAGWEAPWAVARILLASSEGPEGPGPWSLVPSSSPDPAGWTLQAPPCSDPLALLQELRSRAGSADGEVAADIHWEAAQPSCWRLPLNWFRPCV